MSATQKLETIRLQISQTLALMQEIRGARLPHPETRDRVLQAIRSHLVAAPVSHAIEMFQAPDPRLGRLPIGPGETVSFLAYVLTPDGLADRLMERIVEAGDPVGMPAMERIAALEELAGKLKTLERAEEIEICALEEAGHSVYRRRDADVGLLLEIWGEPNFKLPAPAAKYLRALESAS